MIRIPILVFVLFSFLASAGPPDPIVIEGNTMGTTYRIIYFDEPQRRDYTRSIDSLLVEVNRAISTYDPQSEISRFNKAKKRLRFESPYFRDILLYAKRVYEGSGGAFDPTVMPLVNAWGFGPAKSHSPDQHVVDSLRQLVGFEKIRVKKRKVIKSQPQIQLDMGGIGQGYGADIIFRFLQSRDIKNVLVELGGEGVAAGRNLLRDQEWTIGILDPGSTPENQFFKAYVGLMDQAFTTSGNYFNYRIIDGRKYGHTIDPVTGYPVQHSLLSASVFMDHCTEADAWATAFMVMGFEKASRELESRGDIDAILLYADENGDIQSFVTPGIRSQVILE